MAVKRILCLFLILALMTAGTACGTQNNKASGPLTITMMEYDMDLRSAVESFNKAQGKELIKAETYFIDQSAEYAEQLKAELANGKGPDIIAIPAYMISDLSKCITNGYFYDLNKLMEKDREFNTGDYFEPVLNAGVVNGGRYFIPYTFMVHAYYSTGEMLDKYNIDPDNPFLSMDNLAQLAEKHAGMAQDGKYLLDKLDIITPSVGAQRDVLYSKAAMDSAKMAGLMDKYKTIQEVVGPSDQMQADFSKLENGEVALLNYPVYSFLMINFPYNAFQSQFVPELCTVAVNSEKEVMAQPVSIIAINANCSDKETAYRFIKHLLTKEEQSHEFLSGLPVNRAAFEVQKGNFLKSQGAVGYAEKLVKELDDLMKGNITCALVDTEAVGILMGEFMAFLEGTKSSGEAVTAMEQRLAEYREKPIAISEEALARSQKSGEDLPVLTVWYLDYNLTAKNAVRSFTEKRKDVRIESKVCSVASAEEGILKMATEIMAGEGPDVICFRPEMFNSLYKTMESGAFCDLNPLIAKDDTFGSLDLNQKALDTGIYQGKRYFIPLRYRMPFLVSTRGILESNGITISDNWNFEDLKKTAEDYATRTGNRHFFSYAVSPGDFISYCGRNFIDYENAQSHFQSEEFIRLLEFYKEISPYIIPYEEVPITERPEESIKSNRFVMDLETALSPDQLMMVNSIYRDTLGEDMVLYPFPTIDGSTERPVLIIDAVAVSQSCKNKEIALDFIEELLSVNIQAAYDQYGNSNITIGLPVNNEALRKDMQDLLNMDTKDKTLTSTSAAGTRSFPMLPLPQTLADRVTQLAGNISVMPAMDKAVEEIIEEGIQSFLDGKRSAREAAKDIDEKVRLFLNE